MPLAALMAAASCSPGSEATARPEDPGQERGFALPSWNAGDYDSRQAPAYIRRIAATGARWVQINPTWYQRTTRDDSPHTTGETASDGSVRHIIGLARAAGLKVLLKPHVDLPGAQDRADIRPSDSRHWFAAYTGFIVHYADLARQAHAAELAVGTELAGVSGDRAGWLGVIAAIRRHFDGPLVYAANYDEYSKVAFWDALDLVGIDAYWPLAARPTTDVAALRRSWRPIAERLSGFAARTHRRILFTEAGYVSQRGTTVAPYSWTISRSNGDDEQAAAYEALLETFGRFPWWAGVHWWMWDDWPGSGETPARLAYTPHGKPAEQVVRRWWRR
ncbi:hypothetical protein [Actinomadura sp. DC4]|uniref:glycoside hydrolase family 113 n=1 Tax=Actinomadura sp. DC4 TaxID=3055069 RepID=UPI0025AFDBBC|nr:hypothetical protein [Actinomadura sp. DC4]